MRPGARTPEELETLFEDAFVIRDREALAQLFEKGAVLVAGDGPQARGGEEIARFATAMTTSSTAPRCGPPTVSTPRLWPLW